MTVRRAAAVVLLVGAALVAPTLGPASAWAAGSLSSKCATPSPGVRFRPSAVGATTFVGEANVRCSATFKFSVVIKDNGSARPGLTRSYGRFGAGATRTGASGAVAPVRGHRYQVVVTVSDGAGRSLGYASNGAPVDLYSVANAASARAERAIAWMTARTGSTALEGRCETAVENAFGTVGKFPTARAAWEASVRQRITHTTGTPPRGALVYYNTSTAGHVAISIGGGRVASTSVGGRIGTAPYRYFQNYLGWADRPLY